MKKLIFILFLIPTLVIGQTTWTGAVDSLWSTPGNWDSGVPDSGTNAVFDNTSFGGVVSDTVYLDVTGDCNDFLWTYSGIAVRFESIDNVLNIHGSIDIDPSCFVVFNYSPVLGGYEYFNFVSSSAETLTLNGVRHGGYWHFNGTGSWTLQDDGGFNVFHLANGTVDINGYDLEVSVFNTLSGTKTLTINNGTITALTQWRDNQPTGFTFNSTGKVILSTGSWGYNLLETKSFDTLSIVRQTPSTAPYYGIALYSNITATGLFEINGAGEGQRVNIKPDYSYWCSLTPYTITTPVVSASYADFMLIEGAGAASWDLSGITGGSGDAGSNVGITFTTPLKMYWSSGSGSLSDASNWYLGSGGTGGAGREPLPQDTLVMDANSFSTSSTITEDLFFWGRHDFEDIDEAVTFNSTCIYSIITESIYWDSGITSNTGWSSKYTRFFCEGTTDLDTEGQLFANYIYMIVDTLILQSDLYVLGSFGRGANDCTYSTTYIDANGHDVKCAGFINNGGTSHQTYMGEGTWTLTGEGYSNNRPLSNGSLRGDSDGTDIYPETSTWELDFSGASYTEFLFDTNAVYNIDIISAPSNAIIRLGTGDWDINNLTASVGDCGIYFYCGYDYSFNSFQADGSAGNLLKLGSWYRATVPSTIYYINTPPNHNLYKKTTGSVICTYLDVSYSNALPWGVEKILNDDFTDIGKVNQVGIDNVTKINTVEIYRWFATSSTDSGNNTGWVITP